MKFLTTIYICWNNKEMSGGCIHQKYKTLVCEQPSMVIIYSAPYEANENGFSAPIIVLRNCEKQIWCSWKMVVLACNQSLNLLFNWTILALPNSARSGSQKKLIISFCFKAGGQLKCHRLAVWSFVQTVFKIGGPIFLKRFSYNDYLFVTYLWIIWTY